MIMMKKKDCRIKKNKRKGKKNKTMMMKAYTDSL